MDLVQCVLLVISGVIVSRAASDSHIKTAVKRSAPEEPLEVLADVDDIDDKRVFRYGKRGAAMLRYGKRPAVFRYGKRDAYDDYFDDADDVTYVKRSDMDSEVKRLFRLGRRANGEEETTAKRVFRYGKRSADIDDIEAEKRKQFRFGKRFDDISERSIRGDASVHLPYRFGDE